MADRGLLLADVNRVRQFSKIARLSRVLKQTEILPDPSGFLWSMAVLGNDYFAVSELGPGAYFGTGSLIQAHYEERVTELQKRPSHDRQRQFEKLLKSLKFGQLSERVLWAICLCAVSHRSSDIAVPAQLLRDLVWGAGAHPNHWRGDLRKLLRSLSYLHVCSDLSELGSNSVLVADFDVPSRGSRTECSTNCEWLNSSKHSHVSIRLGLGFLGCLEDLALDDPSNSGSRIYRLPRRGDDPNQWREAMKALRAVGKTGLLQQVALATKLGRRSEVKRLSPAARRMLDVLLRETTRARRQKGDTQALPEKIVAASVRMQSENQNCPLLDPTETYVGFNGNGVRKGLGYRLSTWLTRGELASELEFVSAIRQLGDWGIITAGFDLRRREWLTIDQIVIKVDFNLRGARALHLRFYTKDDYLERWKKSLSWSDPAARSDVEVPLGAAALSLIRNAQVSRRSVANAIGMDPSTLSKMLNGKRKLPPMLYQQIKEATAPSGPSKVEIAAECPRAFANPPVSVGRRSVNVDMRGAALECVSRGWSVVPQASQKKHPRIKWKPFQTRYPTTAEIEDWWGRWPETGLILITGQMSNVFVIDVDSEEAHNELVSRLGELPKVPTVVSGSDDPCRYHLYFQHPNFETKAKLTPWHPQLEFRGNNSLVVLPPSLHKSGNRYHWAEGKSIDEIPLRPLPDSILAVLHNSMKPAHQTDNVQQVTAGPLSASTREFLTGVVANGPDWNARLFRAACDFHARGIPIVKAEPQLLAGAQPWDATELMNAKRTIESAYSERRTMSYA